MRLFACVAILVLIAVPALDAEQHGGTAAESADVVYSNGKIYTVDESSPWAEAVAIKGKRFIAVGSAAEVQPSIGPATKVVDLEGRFVMPGMYDMHTHVDLLLEPKYTNGIQTEPLGPSPLKERLLEFAEEHPGDGWIFGGTWTPADFALEETVPGRAYLDEFIPNRPVAILDTSRHMLMLNSRALELAGIDENTFVPEHGEMPMDDNGSPQGVLVDGAQSLASHVLPQADIRTMEEIYAEGQQILNSYGIVGTRSQHVNSTRLKAVQSLDRKDQLTARFDMAISWKNDLHLTVPDRASLITGERHRYRSERVNASHIKFHYDGQPMGRTALFIDPYRGFEDHHGRTNETVEEMRDLLIDMDKRGITCNIHAVGDMAIRQALNAIETARKENGPGGPRHVVLHTAYMHPDDAPRFKELNAIAEFTYSYILEEMTPLASWLATDVLPESAAPQLINIKPILDNGGRAVFGSDLVVASTPEPFENFAVVTARPAPFESITLEQAMRMATINGAYAMGLESEAGSIEAGKFADLVVLSANPFEISNEEIAAVQALTTVFEGREVFSRE